MKVKLLKEIRAKSWSKYEVRNWGNSNPSYKEKPWVIGCGVKQALGSQYASREEAIEVMKLLWHEDAIKYLWENRTKRKRNKYPW